jgi:hypothetical protein
MPLASAAFAQTQVSFIDNLCEKSSIFDCHFTAASTWSEPALTKEASLSAGAICGIVVACLAGAGGAAAIVWWVRRPPRPSSGSYSSVEMEFCTETHTVEEITTIGEMTSLDGPPTLSTFVPDDWGISFDQM